jgi:hypothetical protein
VEKGRKEIKAQDDSLIRAQRIVESTIEVRHSKAAWRLSACMEPSKWLSMHRSAAVPCPGCRWAIMHAQVLR